MKILHDFFQRVSKGNLSLKPSKCRIGYGKVDFLALHENYIDPQTTSVRRILQMERPKQRNSALVFWAYQIVWR